MERVYWLLIILVLSLALLWQAGQMPPPRCNLPNETAGPVMPA